MHIDRQIDLHLNNIPAHKIPSHFDKDDLRQNVYVSLFEAYRRYDPQRSSQNTFQDRVIRRCLREQLSGLRWRKNRGERSLSDCVGEREPVHNDVRSGELRRNEKSVFQSEVRNVIDTLPRDLRRCCELLMFYTPQEVGEKMKMPQVYVLRKMAKIRSAFCKSGLNANYCPT